MSRMPTEEEIAYMMAHIDDSLVPSIIAASAVSCFFSVIILGLRVWSRFQTTRILNLGDYMMISSVVFFIAFCTVFSLSTRYGAGRHIILITDPEDMRMLAILNILNPILYGIAAAFVKASILALYINIFPQKNFKWWVHTMSAINWLNCAAIVLVSCLQCRPLESLWDPTVAGTCINFSHFSLFNTSFNFALDVVILVSPLPLVMKLKLSMRKRVMLAINFALGGGACIVALIRLPYARKVGGTINPSWDMIPGGLLCVAEVVVAQLCACLAVYRPLLRRFAPGLTTTVGQSGYRGNSVGTNDFLASTGTNTRITASANRTGTRRPGIAITDDISMMTHKYVNGKWVRVSDDDDEAGLVLNKDSVNTSVHSIHST